MSVPTAACARSIDGYVPRVRDALVATLCDSVLCLASPRCRAITSSALHKGLLELAGRHPHQTHSGPRRDPGPDGAADRELTLMRDYHGGARDRTIAKLCDGLLWLASRQYRTIIRTAAAAGMNQMISEQSPALPFDEPLDD